MIKKVVIIFISLLALFDVGIYLSLDKKPPVLPQKPVTQQSYINPAFGYTLEIPDQYEMRSQLVPEEIKKGGVDRTCLTLKTDNSCIITLDSLPNTGNVTMESFFQNNSSSSATFKKTAVGSYPLVTWQNQSTVRYLLINNKIMLHISFDAKYSQPAKDVLGTIKM